MVSACCWPILVIFHFWVEQALCPTMGPFVTTVMAVSLSSAFVIVFYDEMEIWPIEETSGFGVWGGHV